MIPFQIEPTLQRRRWHHAPPAPARRAQSRRAILPGWWLAATLFIAVAAIEAAIVLEAGAPIIGLGDCCVFP
ncbi:MAG TPA: hypothetical protein VLX85_03810 [Stellaceae bacterium]|nr:hypothetical protein [Stellaceae bacterium]